jgi:hypothetical protein
VALKPPHHHDKVETPSVGIVMGYTLIFWKQENIFQEKDLLQSLRSGTRSFL